MSVRLRHILAWTALTGILLVLAVRITLLEVTVRSIPHLAALHDRHHPQALPFPGPTEIVGAGIITLALVALAAMAADKCGKVAWLLLALLGGILVCGVLGSVEAANHFAALVGVFDAGMGLLAGWAMFILCTTDRRRQFLVVVLVGFLTMLIVKGFYQHYVAIPETVHYFFNHQAQYARQMGWKINSPEMKLYVARLNSREVTGFFDLSDALAEALCPLLMVVVALVMALLAARRNEAVPLRPLTVPAVKSARAGLRGAVGAANPGTMNPDIPLPLVLAAVLGVILLGGIVVLAFTKSKGGMASVGLCLVALLLGWRCRHWLAEHRRAVAAAVVAAVLLTAVGLVAWGLHFHRLPTKDLKFRWDYWTGALPMIVHHPLVGVGLNNFGYYYTQYKLPGAPEDVKNPHNMFVRVATEMGLPAMVLWALVLALYARELLGLPQPTSPRRAAVPPLWALATFTVIWWMLRIRIVGVTAHTAVYVWLQAGLYGGAAWIGMVLAGQAWVEITPQGRRLVALAGVLGAGGMLLYDQVNMAQVTGSVAMLFWVVVGGFIAPLSSSVELPLAESTDRWYPRGAGFMLGSLGLIGSILAAIFIWVPIARGTLPWNPRIEARNFARNVAAGDWSAALRNAEAVFHRDKRSQNWLGQIIALKMRLGKDPAEQVQRMLELNRADARFRVRLVATPACGLSVQERLAQLQLALKLNAQLPRTEPARFDMRELAHIQQLIGQLQKGNAQATLQ